MNCGTAWATLAMLFTSYLRFPPVKAPGWPTLTRPGNFIRSHGGDGINAAAPRGDRRTVKPFGICTSSKPETHSSCGRRCRTSLDAADVPPLGVTYDDLSASAHSTPSYAERSTIERTKADGR